MIKDLQKLLDDLIKACGETYKISGNKIVQVKDPVFKTVLRISSVYYDRYVGEKGALYQYDDWDQPLPKELADLIKEKQPLFISVVNQDNEYDFSHIEFDGEKVELEKKTINDLDYFFTMDHMEEFKILVFTKRKDGYYLDLTASGIFLGDDQGDMIKLSMKFVDVERCQKSRHEEMFD